MISRLLSAVIILAISVVLSSNTFGHDDANDADLIWASGDTHLHAHGCGPADWSSEGLVGLLVENDLNVGNVLVWAPGYEIDRARFTGRDDPASLPDHILHYDLEVSGFASGHTGHLNILGLTDIDFSDDPFAGPRTGLPIVDFAVQQGDRVVVGMNHAWAWPGTDGVFPLPDANGTFGACCQLLEFPVHVALGTASFLEEEIPASSRVPLSNGASHLWRVLQNSGFRVALTGASDFLCIHNDLSRPNVMRTHVLVDGELTYETFLEGIKHGRTIAAVGGLDHMDFTLNDVRLGGDVHVSAGQPMSVNLRTHFADAQEVRLFVNGIQAQTIDVQAGSQMTTVELAVDQSSWITAQSSRVQTSPIYALVDDQPVRASADDACYLVQYMDRLKTYVRTGAITGVSLDEVEPAYEEARNVFVQRFREAGGTTCASANSASLIHSLRDNDGDGIGDRTLNSQRATRSEVGELNISNARSHLARLVAKFDLPLRDEKLESATLRLFLHSVEGVPHGPVQVYHSIDDNERSFSAQHYENDLYVTTSLELVQPGDEVGRFYEVDVTDWVRADYATDGNDPVAAFRFQVDEADLILDSQSNMYRFSMPGRGRQEPALILSFVPEPSGGTLVIIGLASLFITRRRNLSISVAAIARVT